MICPRSGNLHTPQAYEYDSLGSCSVHRTKHSSTDEYLLATHGGNYSSMDEYPSQKTWGEHSFVDEYYLFDEGSSRVFVACTRIRAGCENLLGKKVCLDVGAKHKKTITPKIA